MPDAEQQRGGQDADIRDGLRGSRGNAGEGGDSDRWIDHGTVLGVCRC